jgi:tol-pal system protein YbgF
MKVFLAALLGFSIAVPVMAQAPVNDISTSHRGSVTGGVAVDQDSGAGVTYGSSDSGYGASESRAARSDNGGYSSGSSRASSASSGGTDNMALYRQFQQLQEEVAALRSQVEEQGYQLQKLKQQPERAASVEPQNSASASASSAAASPAVPASNNTEGGADYEAAYAKLKAKDYDGAMAAFKAFVVKYPTSEYSGNAYFWLGFVYQTKGDIDNAGKSFSAMIDRFPSHAKADDAKYNLGKIYHQQGNKEKARALLKDVAAGTSKSAPLAKSYMESM